MEKKTLEDLMVTIKTDMTQFKADVEDATASLKVLQNGSVETLRALIKMLKEELGENNMLFVLPQILQITVQVSAYAGLSQALNQAKEETKTEILNSMNRGGEFALASGRCR